MQIEQIQSLYNNGLWSNLVHSAPFVLSSGNCQEYSSLQRQQLMVLFADAFLETKSWRKAEALYKDALQLKKLSKPAKKTSACGPPLPAGLTSISPSEANSSSFEPSETDIKYKIHLCYVNTGQHSQAVNMLKSIPAKQRTAKCNMALGKLYQQAAMERPAIGCYREVLKACPMAIEAAEALMLLGVKGLEIQELTLDATSGSSSMDWYLMWSQAYSAFAQRNDYATAIALLKQLEDHPVCRNNLSILVTLGTSQYYHGDDSSAILTLQRVHRIDPNHLGGMDILAALLARERRIKELEQLATRLMSISEDAAEPWIAMGYYCYVGKKGSRSLYFAHKACVIDRSNVEALILKGNILLDVKKLQDAMNHFREAVIAAPYRYETHKGMVDCYLAQSRHREAVSVATSSCKQLNNSPRALTLYASVLCKDPLQLSSTKAISLLEKALSLNRHYLPAAYVLAEILEQEGSLDKGIDLLRKQLAFKSTSKLHCMLANLLAKSNDLEQAMEHYRTALNLDPKYTAAQEGLQRIEQVTDGTSGHDGGGNPGGSSVACNSGVSIAAGGYGDLEMEEIDSEAEDDDDDDPADLDSETEAVWSDGDLNNY